MNQNVCVRSSVQVTFRLRLVYLLSSKTVANSLSGIQKNQYWLDQQYLHLLWKHAPIRTILKNRQLPSIFFLLLFVDGPLRVAAIPWLHYFIIKPIKALQSLKRAAIISLAVINVRNKQTKIKVFKNVLVNISNEVSFIDKNPSLGFYALAIECGYCKIYKETLRTLKTDLRVTHLHFLSSPFLSSLGLV